MTKRTGLTVATLLVAGLAFSQPAQAQQADRPAERADALLGMARVKRDAGDTAAARKYFEDARRLRPFDAAQLAEYFWIVAGQDPRGAVEIGGEVLARTPKNADVRDRMITESIALGDETAVVALATDGQRLDPSTARWPRRLGESYLRQARPAEAATAFAQAAAAPDAATDDLAALAVSLEASHRYPDAAAAWDRVPASARAQREDWTLSRLRALAHSGEPATSSAEIESWLKAHPDDDGMRELLADVWLRAGQPDRAISALSAGSTGARSETWARRRLAIARGAGRHSAALAALDELASMGKATPEDRWARAELLLAAGEVDRATATLKTLQVASTKCSDRLFAAIDQIPDDRGTTMMLDLLGAPSCQPATKWLMRGIERSIAASRHLDALTLFARLPVAEAGRPQMQRLAGQLHLWTGDAQAAIRLLEPVVRVSPEDRAAREALVDAYRADQRADSAWRTAEPLLTATDVTVERLVSLAELALEADRPEQVAPLLARVPEARRNASHLILQGRAQLAAGRPAGARATLSSLAPNDVTPGAVLALIDSTLAMAGPTAALETARRFDNNSREWREVLARRVMLEAVAGDTTQAASLRRSLSSIDEAAAVIADAETALTRQRPAEARAALATLSNDPQSERAADLDSIALGQLGRFDDALALVADLRQLHPSSLTLRMRQAELTFQKQSTPESLATILGLAAEHPADRRAAVLAARSLASLRRHDEALRALGSESAWSTLPLEGVIVAIRSLQATGRPQDALTLLEHTPASHAEAAALRAESLEQLAATQWANGDRANARLSASRALDLDSRAAGAWLVLFDAALADGSDADLDLVLRRFESAASAQPALAIRVADRLAAHVRSTDGPLAARALQLLDAVVPADAAMAITRDLARSRVLAATAQWNDALAAVDRALGVDAQSADALKLRAELLSYAARHAESLDAYDTYFMVRPNDIDARRQQARVAGWAGWTDRARQLYADVAQRFPTDAAVAAEVAAKTAFFDGRWNAASGAYVRWIELEPSNGEARFEWAESLRASGRVAASESALVALSAVSRHQLAEASLQRSRASRGPTANAVFDQRSSNGYDGQRLLDLLVEGASVGTTLGQFGQTTVSAEGAFARANGDDASRRGYRAGLTAAGRLSPSFGFNARAIIWDFANTAGNIADVKLRGSWRPADRWTIGVSADREPLFENLATIDAGVVGTGASADAGFDSPRTTVQARLSAQSLSDGNSRTRATVSMTQALGDRFRQVRLIGWAESLRYRTSTDTYFSPSRQLRVDGGAEYTHEFFTPRFRGDRTQRITGGYLIGFDNEGTMYHHPTARLTVEFANGLAFDARADWIRSDVYRETSAYVGLRVGTSRRD